MTLLRWFTKNWANTTEPTHADLGPFDRAVPVADALRGIVETIKTMPNWSVVALDAVAGTLHLTRRTGTIRYIDDVRLTASQIASGCRIHAESRSRVASATSGRIGEISSNCGRRFETEQATDECFGHR